MAEPTSSRHRSGPVGVPANQCGGGRLGAVVAAPFFADRAKKKEVRRRNVVMKAGADFLDSVEPRRGGGMRRRRGSRHTLRHKLDADGALAVRQFCDTAGMWLPGAPIARSTWAPDGWS